MKLLVMQLCTRASIKLLLNSNSTRFQFSFSPSLPFSLPYFSVFCTYSMDGSIQVFLLLKKTVPERRAVLVSTPLRVGKILAGFFLA
jgi:hypothetical protein